MSGLGKLSLTFNSSPTWGQEQWRLGRRASKCEKCQLFQVGSLWRGNSTFEWRAELVIWESGGALKQESMQQSRRTRKEWRTAR